MIQKHIVEFFGVFRRAMRQKKGFTLIELLVVIAILGLLAAVVVINLNPAANLAQTRDARRIADLSSIKDAMELYAFNNVNGQYPAALTSLVPDYLSTVPKDPSTSLDYVYCGDVTKFAVGVALETTKYIGTQGSALPCSLTGHTVGFCGSSPYTSKYQCVSGKK